jgi:2-iminobutanoate/2-iminopropanoate deaminase
LLAQVGCTHADIVKATIFLKDMADYATVNSVYATYFTADPPARSAVAVRELPKGMPIEIEVIAVKPS